MSIPVKHFDYTLLTDSIFLKEKKNLNLKTKCIEIPINF